MTITIFIIKIYVYHGSVSCNNVNRLLNSQLCSRLMCIQTVFDPKKMNKLNERTNIKANNYDIIKSKNKLKLTDIWLLMSSNGNRL